MITIKDIRKNVIRSFVVKELLDESVYPTLDEICAKILSDYDGIDAYSTMLTGKYALNPNDVASKTWINDINKITKLDIRTIYSFIDYLYDYLTSNYTIGINKISALNTATDLLMGEIKELSLLSNNFGKDINVVSDNFYNVNNIDLLNSDANISLQHHKITSKTINTEKLRYIDNNVDSVNMNVTTQGYTVFTSITDPISIVSGNNLKWTSYLTMPVSYSGTVITMLDITLKTPDTFNTISLLLDTVSSLDIQVIALIDNTFKTISDYTTYTNTASIVFDPITTQRILLFFRTSSSESIDGNSKKYKFSIGNMQVGNLMFANTSLLYTNAFALTNTFSQIMLSVNSNINTASSINYYIAYRLNSGTWSSFAQITPYDSDVNKSTRTLSIIPSFGQNTSSASIDFTKIHTYLNGYNVATTYTESSLNYLSLEQPHILRNLNHINVQSSKKVGSAVLFVKTNDMIIDFSLFPGSINGNMINGPMTLKAGIYNFVFSLVNGLDRYTKFFSDISTGSSNNFYFGSNISTYMDSVLFTTHVEDNDYTYFSFVSIDGTNTAIIKEINDSETMLVIKKTVVGIDPSTLPNQIKMKIEFLSDNTNTSELISYQIKTL